VPTKYKEDPALGDWVNLQRVVFKKSRMKPERTAKLNKIGFDFKPHKENWNLQFKKLRDYYEKHGHCELFGLSTLLPSS
jgi:hypothetical protein